MLEQFDYMYKYAWDLDTVVNKETEEYRAFSSKNGLPVKVFKLPEHLDIVPLVKEYYKQIREAKCLYVIPCDTFDSDVPLGYVMRGVGHKEYSCVFARPEKGASFQPTFGWYDFESYEQGMPIIITEGIKDALYLKKIYPYTLAALSCKMSDALCKMLSSLTKNVIIAFDSDEAGNNAAKTATTKLGKFGINAKRAMPPAGLKDFGECFSNIGIDISVKMSLNMLLSIPK